MGLAEMAFAGELGANIDLQHVPRDMDELLVEERRIALLFAESNSRFVCEVPAEHCQQFEEIFAAADVVCGAIGSVTDDPALIIQETGDQVIHERCSTLKESWQSPLRW